ncbi:MAG TPA: DHA2 family efflux MFS transporter permease subunit, partial [Stellaceae bacterium]|nr:DHA2 family efflux MFS transporter permease subunit [Stellaceae bacterium]
GLRRPIGFVAAAGIGSRAVRSESTAALSPNRGMITATIICACVMQGVDTTIANVALPHIQGSMSAAQDQISWVLTSYIVASAIMMPLTGWLAGRFGVKYIFLASVIGFTFASALCGAATSLGQLVLYRLLQGICSAGLVPLGQATLFTIYPREKHGQAMAIFSTGAMMGPIVGPTLGGWLTENFDWRWCFYINLPVGALCALGILAFIRPSGHLRRDPFDGLGFALLSIAVGSLQLMLDRGQLQDWFHSTEIWIEATVAALCFYLLVVHTMTADERSFVNRDLLKSPNFVAGSVLMFGVGMILSGTLALLPSMMQVLMNYPVFDAGWMMAPRGLGTMLAMFIVARLIDKIDNRVFILVGFLLTAASLWQMTGYSLLMGSWPILFAGFSQGFGLGCTFVPLNLLALSGLPHHILTQGTAMRALMRMLGGSIGIAILETQLTQNTQIVHSRLVEWLRPDNPLAQAPVMPAPFDLTTAHGIAALNHEITRQAAMIGYIDDFALMLIVILVSLPLLLLVRGPRRRPVPAAADD